MPIKERILKELSEAPMKFKKLQNKFKASKKFFVAVNELYDEGKIEEVNGLVRLVKPKKSRARDKSDLIPGTVVKLTENFGFVRSEDLQKDIFVSGKYMMGAIPGDKVLVKKIPSQRRDFEGEIAEIVEEKKNVIAIALYKGGKLYATLKDCPYVTMKVMNRVYAKNDDIMVVTVNNRGTSHRNLTCYAESVIGRVSSSQKATEVLIAEKNVETGFSRNVLRRANEAVDGVDFEAEAAKREDFTNLPIFTIDSASTKDIDDAIHIEKLENGYRLGVHIADVSFYVRGGTDSDSDAYKRGTSIYFGNNVIPMLPQIFSNDVCSLNEKSRRLAFSCVMDMDKDGNVTNYRFVKSLIYSRVKGVYSEINAILAGEADEKIKEKYAEVYDEIFLGKELYDILRKKHIRRGSMDIESEEAYFIFDETGKAVDIVKRDRGLSEMMIEEFMLAANSCSANLAKKANIPFVYRIHEEPSAEKLTELKDNLLRLNLTLDTSKGKSLQQAMSEILDKTRGTNLEMTVHKMILRSQSKAKYSEEKIGHFGLVLDDYSHFTSPIRRYADLAIHRILSDYVSGKNIDAVRKRYAKFAPSRAKQASETELVAMSIERDADDIYKAEIMADHVGESYTGIISSVTTFGVYVTLENTVEGLVHVSMLGMIEPQLAEGYSLSCPVSGKIYRIGDEMAVTVVGTDILNGNIDFAPVGVKPTKPGDRKREKPKNLKNDSSRKDRDRRGEKKSAGKRQRNSDKKETRRRREKTQAGRSTRDEKEISRGRQRRRYERKKR